MQRSVSVMRIVEVFIFVSGEFRKNLASLSRQFAASANHRLEFDQRSQRSISSHNENACRCSDVDWRQAKFVLVLRVKCLKSSEQAPMWRNGRRNGLKIRLAIKGPCRFESG